MKCLRHLWRICSFGSCTRQISQTTLNTTRSGLYTNVYGLRNSCAVRKSYTKHLCMWTRANITANLMSKESSGLQSDAFYGEQEALFAEFSHQSSFDQTKPSKKTTKGTKAFGPYEYEFDIDGYLSIQDLVKFLKHESAFDICVIKTSGARSSYVDYFVVVSGVSNRHIHAMAKNLETLFREQEVRGVGKDGHVSVEGLGTDNWLALDIGNIAVHFFLPETRAIYELEKLWTLGPQYDDQFRSLKQHEDFLNAVFIGPQNEERIEGGND